jgi:carboxypeptidase Q
MTPRLIACVCVWPLLVATPELPAASAENVDLAVVQRIKAEAFQRSRVMEHVFFLSDVYGPRPTGSANHRAAAQWAERTLKGWKLANVHLDKWGVVEQPWSYTRFSAHLLEPVTAPLIGYPAVGTPGFDGPVTADVALAPVAKISDLAKYKGRLRGKFVLVTAAQALNPADGPDVRRFTPDELVEMGRVSQPGPHWPLAAPFPRPGAPEKADELRKLQGATGRFLKDEGALALIVPPTKGDYGTVFSVSAGTRDLPVVALAIEHYNRIARLLENEQPVRLELDVRTQVGPRPVDGWNVVAELPGSRKKDELVIIGAHLDSIHIGTGATDNATGCAVVMEVMRILGSIGVPMDRTVRMILWDSEEAGQRGSKNYVKTHFADPETMVLKPGHAKLSGYFNLDRGSGKIRGVYLTGHEMMRPIFEAWLAPFREMGAGTVLIFGERGRTDHQSFEAVGLPGFEFLQDPLDYNTRTHHSNMDVTDRVAPGDLMQSAAVFASIAYHAAVRPELLPRKPVPGRPGAR